MADDSKLDKIENKIDHISDKINSIDVTLAAQHVSLREHMRRTQILEEEVKPIKEHVDGLKGVVRFLKIAALVAGIAEAARLFWR